MTLHVPEWTRAEPGTPPPLPAPGRSDGRVVAVVATDGAVSGAWAAEVAVDMARGWSALGMRLVLADGGLDGPSLHLTLTEIAGEGVTDVLRWGVSVRRVARRPRGSSFFAIPAGTPVADGPALLEGPRWPALCAGFREAGVTLAVLVPARDGCLAAILEQADAMVVLAAPGESVPLALRAGEVPILGVIGRDASPPVPPPESPAPAFREVPSPESGSGMEGLPRGLQDAFEVKADLPSFTPESDSEQEPDPGPEPALEPETGPATSPELLPEPELHGEPVPTFEEIVEESRSAGAGSRWTQRRNLAALAVVILALAAAVVATLLGYLRIPGFSVRQFGSGALSSAAQAQATLAVPPAAETSAPALASVAFAEFQDEEIALARVRDPSEIVPGVVFTNVPVAAGGKILHRVLAGPAADSAAALTLGARVAAAAGLGAGEWEARQAPRSFVPAVTYYDGSIRFRVYSGAYADESEAASLSGLLQDRGLSSATLSDRTGRIAE